MSRFFSEKYKDLEPYVPGEQPKRGTMIKLNTNESPYPPSPKAVKAAAKAAEDLELYSDPKCLAARETIAKLFGVESDMVICGNGSDDLLNFAAMAWCDGGRPLVSPEISYGFYPVIAELQRVAIKRIPLKKDFTIEPADYLASGGTVMIANPNAPTGLALSVSDIRVIVEGNPDVPVVIDEAYVDFGAESCAGLVKDYDNLLVIQTLSKSRSMAGGRFGFAIGDKALIKDLEAIRYSTNPYNVNSMTMAAACAALEDTGYTKECCQKIAETRERTAKELKELGFSMTDSKANFIFARHPSISGKDLFLRLREKWILVRHFDKPAIADYNRISIGTAEQMEALVAAAKEILEENGRTGR